MQLLMPPTQFGLRPRYLCEHPCVQTQSDHSQCYRGLQGLARDAGREHLCEVTVSVSHSWTWGCCGRSNLYREQALDRAQIELFTWLVRLCCGITWKCTDIQRGFRAQTLREKCFCDYTPSTLTYKCSYNWNPPFYSIRTLKWTWTEVFTPLVTLPSCI